MNWVTVLATELLTGSVVYWLTCSPTYTIRRREPSTSSATQSKRTNNE